MSVDAVALTVLQVLTYYLGSVFTHVALYFQWIRIPRCCENNCSHNECWLVPSLIFWPATVLFNCIIRPHIYIAEHFPEWIAKYRQRIEERHRIAVLRGTVPTFPEPEIRDMLETTFEEMEKNAGHCKP